MSFFSRFRTKNRFFCCCCSSVFNLKCYETYNLHKLYSLQFCFINISSNVTNNIRFKRDKILCTHSHTQKITGSITEFRPIFADGSFMLDWCHAMCKVEIAVIKAKIGFLISYSINGVFLFIVSNSIGMVFTKDNAQYATSIQNKYFNKNQFK